MSTTFTTTRRVATTAVLVGAAALMAAPTYAQVAPVDTSGDQTGGQSAEHPTKAQVEHDEQSGAAGPGLRPVDLEHYRQHYAPQAPAGGTSSNSDPSSVPVTVLVLLGGGLAAGAAGYTIYRFRRQGPVGAATA